MKNGRDAPLGLVLVGGQSRRMGRDKALLRLGGESLAERAAQRLAPLVRRVYLATSHPERYAAIPLPAIPDAFGGLGPLDALAGALGLGDALILATDLPFVPTTFLKALIDRAGADGALFADGERLEPLAAFYRRSSRPQALATLMGDRSMRTFISKIQVARLGPDDVRPFGDPERVFLNVNDPEAFALATRILAEGPDGE